MRYWFAFIFCFFLISSESDAQYIDDVNIDGLEAVTRNLNDTTYVVNFWATWCSPCVKEIGYFEELHRQFNSSNVKVILVNLDFPNQVDRRVRPFLKQKEITADVLLMTDLDYNAWIDKVDPSWQGNIPATLLFNNSKKTRHFHPGEIDEAGLRELINQYL